jgi:hypothetical protein
LLRNDEQCPNFVRRRKKKKKKWRKRKKTPVPNVSVWLVVPTRSLNPEEDKTRLLKYILYA